MTYGIKALRQIQMSRESTQGTSTTDFTPWRGTGTLEDMRETVFPEEDIGIFGGVDRNYSPKTGGQLVLSDTPATFEQLPHIFDAGIALATPTSDDSSAFIYTYTLPIASATAKASTDLQTFGFKGGDNTEVEQANFGFVSDFSLTGNAGEALMMAATFQTRGVTTDNDGFATVTIPTVEEILFSKGKLYIDAIGGSGYGSTQKSGTLLSMDLKATTGWQAVHSADGRTDFAFIKQTQPEILLDVTFEHDGTAQAEKAAWRGGTARQIQLKFEGTALTDAVGGTYAVKTLIVNLTGKWEKFSALDEQDGNDIVTGTFRARYNATSGTYAAFIVANELSEMAG